MAVSDDDDVFDDDRADSLATLHMMEVAYRYLARKVDARMTGAQSAATRSPLPVSRGPIEDGRSDGEGDAADRASGMDDGTVRHSLPEAPPPGADAKTVNSILREAVIITLGVREGARLRAGQIAEYVAAAWAWGDKINDLKIRISAVLQKARKEDPPCTQMKQVKTASGMSHVHYLTPHGSSLCQALTKRRSLADDNSGACNGDGAKRADAGPS